MTTPVYDFLMNYRKSDTARLHMPGHKGNAPVAELDLLYSLDITEIKMQTVFLKQTELLPKVRKMLPRFSVLPQLSIPLQALRFVFRQCFHL